jgi:uncharacterized OB-fold protein
MTARPVPVPDETSADYWAACAGHVLKLARCARCGQFSHPPDIICPLCHSPDPAFSFEPVTGRGRLRSWTIVRQSFLNGFDVPFMLVDVELDDQPTVRMIGRLLDGPDAAVALGAPVTLGFEDIAPGVAVPAFSLAGAA